MKQFKDLTIEEKLDLIEYYLRGGNLTLSNEDKSVTLPVSKFEKDLRFKGSYYYQKDTTKLNNLYKELSSLKEQIAQEESLLGASPQGDITLPIQSSSEEDKTSEKGSHVARDVVVDGNPTKERITVDNWKSLGIKVGDWVDVVGQYDKDIPDGVYHIRSIDEVGNGLPFELDAVFIGAEHCEELWLIRTEEGSL